MTVPWYLRLERVARGVEELRCAALAAEQEFRTELDLVAPTMRDSALNLVHYLAVRRHDVRELQDELARLGLSSLGRMEAHVMASLNAVLEVLRALQSQSLSDLKAAPISFDTGAALLAEHANTMLGAAPAGRETRIMVTMPGEAADDPDLIRELVEAGMGIMRINCAHDSPETWERMIAHLRRAEHELGRRCLVSFDLAGPKLRTGPIAPGPAVVKLRPSRDAIGEVIRPARVWLVARHNECDAQEPAIPVEPTLVETTTPGDTVVFADARDRKRVLRVVEVRSGKCLCEADRTAYVVPEMPLTLRRNGKPIASGNVGALPAVKQSIVLRAGDILDIAHGVTPGRGATRAEDGRAAAPAFVSCALAEVFSGVRVGQPILFDDGLIKGIIRRASLDRLEVEITAVAGGRAALKAEKGINLPESELALPALTAKDLEDLAFVVTHADTVALSFVQHPADIDALLRELGKLDASKLGIVLKIETRAAFERLPVLLLSAMRHPRLAVMVARGDLGVEMGFERLSEVQEEILWLCEAAHVPVIWATQVLESLAKGGMPSRAEVTDAAMGSRAECVMLNKGPYIRETLRFLTDVLKRMEEHQHKKTARLRKLRVSDASSSRLRRQKSVESVNGVDVPRSTTEGSSRRDGRGPPPAQ
jgi:pyruvate kinase